MTHCIYKYQLYPFWDNEYQSLQYAKEDFNDPEQCQQWLLQGHANNFTGCMCDMQSPQPTWNQRFIEMFANQGWQNVGTSYYRMDTGTVLPTHGDLYKKYIDIFALKGREHTIRRAVVFLQDWQPGHYAEYLDQAHVNWKAGSTVEWTYDTPHMAANLGPTPRYTLQITGHVDD